MKVALIVVGLTVLVLAALVGGGYWWWQTQGPAMIADIKTAQADAARFAAGKDTSACVDEAAARAKTAGFLAFGIPVRTFLTDCLRRARYASGFCDDVPSPMSVFTAITWRNALNEKYGLKGPFQASILPPEIQQYCQARAK